MGEETAHMEVPNLGAKSQSGMKAFVCVGLSGEELRNEVSRANDSSHEPQHRCLSHTEWHKGSLQVGGTKARRPGHRHLVKALCVEGLVRLQRTSPAPAPDVKSFQSGTLRILVQRKGFL
jgi:hypothetical protein